MRIAIVTTEFPTLSETFIANKVKALAARGHTVRVFTGKKNNDLLTRFYEGNTTVSVVEFTIKNLLKNIASHPLDLLKSVTERKRKKYLYNICRVRNINYFKPDISHFEFSGVGVDYLSVFNQIHGKKVVSCRGSGEKIKLLVSSERKKSFAQLMHASDSIHCVSADMQNTIKEYVEFNKTFINYPSIDAQYFSRRIPFKRNSTPIIISIGRFTFQKNYLIGLLTMKNLADRGIDFKWMIVGSGVQYEEIVFHIHQLQLQNIVELIGTKKSDEIKDLLEGADIFFLPSVYEGIANAALEAMSMQLPLVSTTCGGMQEVITCGENGLLADVYDYKRLAAHIEYLLSHPAEAKVMGAAARERILEQFTLEHQTNTFERIYKQLLTA